MSIAQMRMKIANAYDGIRWKNRVQFMPDNQVVAVYHSLKKSGKLEPKKKDKGPKDIFHQITIWEVLNERNEANV